MLGYFLVAAAVVLGLAATGGNLLQVGGYFLQGLLDWSTLQLLGVVTVIEMLSVFLDCTGSLDRMLGALRRVFRSARVLIALVPSVLGLFPVPGGAMLSAPMVEKYGEELAFDPDEKASVNLFFRHVWDQAVPFKPHLILAATVLKMPIFTLIGWQLPVTLGTGLVGYWVLVGSKPKVSAHYSWEPPDPTPDYPLWLDIAPLVIPLLLALLLGMDFLYAMTIGLLTGLIVQRVSRDVLWKMVRKGVQPKLLFLLAAVMIFKTVVDQTGLVKAAALLLTGYGIPLPLLVLLLPLAVGAATGMDTAAVAMVFPLLVGMVPQGVSQLPFVLVMLASGFVGSTLSPAHVCMAAGNHYYGASMGRVVRLSVLPHLFRIAATVALAWLIASYMTL